MTTNYNTQYNIPRVQVQLPGRQNRLTDGVFRITPSMTEPVAFIFGNQDGKPLAVQGFKLQFVVWESSPNSLNHLSLGQSEIVINKRILIDDPYSNYVEMILTEEETLKIGNKSSGNQISWSLFFINDDDQVFPMQVSNNGGRYGNIIVDLAGAMPVAELIRTPTG